MFGNGWPWDIEWRIRGESASIRRGLDRDLDRGVGRHLVLLDHILKSLDAVVAIRDLVVGAGGVVSGYRHGDDVKAFFQRRERGLLGETNVAAVMMRHG